MQIAPEFKKCKGIYKITCLGNNEFYIGSTTTSFSHRLSRHLDQLNSQRHHSPYMSRSYLKYGGDSFIFEVLEVVFDKNLIINREQYWIDLLHPAFNCCQTAIPNLGKKLSQEHKDQISKTLRKKYAEGTIKRHPMLFTEEIRRKIGEKSKGRTSGIKNHNAKLTDDLVRKIRKAHKRGSSIRSLARKYSMDKSTINAVVKRETWRHVR